VLFQPVVDIRDGRLTAVEALVRWHRDDGTVWLPEQFLPAADQDGTIVEIDRWVLRQALTALARWRAQGLGDDVPVSVNVSPSDVAAPGFADEVLFLLDELGLSASALVLELQEQGLVDVAGERSPLVALRARGVRLCLDDFGTGHSSLTALRELPVDLIKLDRALAASLDGSDPRQLATVESVLLLASGLSLDVVVEGVETVSEHATLRGLGVREGQGWLFGRPMTADALLEWMGASVSAASRMRDAWPASVR